MKENNWFDPFYIQSHLNEEESNIQKNVRDFCNNELKPRVVESNRKNEFDQNLYPKFGSLGKLRVKVLDKINVEGLSEDDIPMLTKKAFNLIKGELENDPKKAAVTATEKWKKILA